MKTLHYRLMDLAEKLKSGGQDEDAATVWSAAMQLIPGPKPTIETLTEPAPGFYHYFKYFG